MSEHREEALKCVGAIGNLRAGRPPVLYPAEQIALAQVHATLYIGEQIGHLIDALYETRST